MSPIFGVGTSMVDHVEHVPRHSVLDPRGPLHHRDGVGESRAGLTRGFVEGADGRIAWPVLLSTIGAR